MKIRLEFFFVDLINGRVHITPTLINEQSFFISIAGRKSSIWLNSLNPEKTSSLLNLEGSYAKNKLKKQKEKLIKKPIFEAKSRDRKKDHLELLLNVHI